ARGCREAAPLRSHQLGDSEKSKRARFHSLDIVLEVLADEVVVHQASIGIRQALRDLAPDLTVGPDLKSVDARYRANAQRARGGEDLVRIVGIVEVDVGFREPQTFLAGKINHRLATDARQHEFLAWRENLAIAHGEDVRTQPLAQVAIDVEQQRPGFWVDALDFLIGDDQVEIIVGLGPRRQRIRRHATVRRDHQADALLEQLGALYERQRRTFEDNIGSMIVDVVARHLLDPATDALADPVIVVGTEQMAVALEQLFGHAAHFLRSEAWIDA